MIVSPIYGGKLSGRLIPQTGTILTRNKFGMDSLIRRYVCKTSEAPQLAPQSGDKDPVLPWFSLDVCSFTESKGLLTELVCSYVGKLDDKLGNVKVDGAWTDQAVTLPTTSAFGTIAAGMILVDDTNEDNFGGGYSTTVYNRQIPQQGECSITYRAPSTNFSYTTREEPTGPKFEGTMLAAVMQVKCVDVRPAGILQRPYGRLTIQTNRFSVSKNGDYWQCEEASVITLVSPSARLIDLSKAMDALKFDAYR